MPSVKEARQRARVQREGIFIAFDEKGKERPRGAKPDLTEPKGSKSKGSEQRRKGESAQDVVDRITSARGRQSTDRANS
jgi:hypothetical protein